LKAARIRCCTTIPDPVHALADLKDPAAAVPLLEALEGTDDSFVEAAMITQTNSPLADVDNWVDRGDKLQFLER